MSYDKGKWTRLFVGNLPNSFSESDLRELFSAYPSLKRVDCAKGYGYVSFGDSKDGSDAIRDVNGRIVDGEPIKVENVDGKSDNRDSSGAGPKYELRIRVYNLSSRTNWPDLKDWARNAGPVKYAAVFNRGSETIGIVEFLSADSFDKSFSVLENIPLMGERVRITKVMLNTLLESPFTTLSFDIAMQEIDERDREAREGIPNREYRGRKDEGRSGGSYRSDRQNYDYGRGDDYGGRDSGRSYPPRNDYGRGGYDSRGRDDYRRPGPSSGEFRSRSRSRERLGARGEATIDRGERGSYDNRGERDNRGGYDSRGDRGGRGSYDNRGGGYDSYRGGDGGRDGGFRGGYERR